MQGFAQLRDESAEIKDIQRRIRAIRRRLAQLNVGDSGGVRGRAELMSKALVPALLQWAVRTLGLSNPHPTSNKRSDFEALEERLSARGITGHAERHPVVAVGIAVGTGLLIGLASIVANQEGLKRRGSERPRVE